MFGSFLESLCDKLYEKEIYTGIIFLDNASIHKSENHKIFLNSKRFELCFLPPYSPQLNPIEEVFSKWKNIIKTQNSESIEKLYENIRLGESLITENDCLEFYAHVRTFVLQGIMKEHFLINISFYSNNI